MGRGEERKSRLERGRKKKEGERARKYQTDEGGRRKA